MDQTDVVAIMAAILRPRLGREAAVAEAVVLYRMVALGK